LIAGDVLLLDTISFRFIIVHCIAAIAYIALFVCVCVCVHVCVFEFPCCYCGE